MNKSARISIGITLALLLGLVMASDGASDGARQGLSLCAQVIVPGLLPFFVVSFLCNELGLTKLPARALTKPMGLLFGVSGSGAAVFFQSILGGYPLGASVIADLIRRGDMSKEEGSRLLSFCNNCGPAFLLGAVGVGIFHSAPIGVLLYVVHVLAAIITGLFLSGTRFPTDTEKRPFIASANLSSALPAAMTMATSQLVLICGYVVFFSAVVGVLQEIGVFSAIYGGLAAHTGMTLRYTKALCMGALEMSCGIGALEGAALCPQALSLASFITGFGGLSVAMQTAGVLHGTGIPLWRHLVGRLCTASISAFLMFTIASTFLQ